MISLLLICQKSDSDEIMFKRFEVLPEALCYNTIFPGWSPREQVGWLVVVCKGVRKKILCAAGDNGGVEWKSFVFRPVQLGKIITLQMNILEYNFSHET